MTADANFMVGTSASGTGSAVSTRPIPTTSTPRRAPAIGRTAIGGPTSRISTSTGLGGFGVSSAPYPDDVSPPPGSCYWQDGYWGPNQPYIDQYGFERFEPAWVPG